MAMAPSEALHGGACGKGCGCQAWHPPDLDEGLSPVEILAQKYKCDGCDHHLSYHACGVDTCSKRLVKRDVAGNVIFDSDGQEVVVGICKCTKFIPDPNSKGLKSCHGCKHHTSFHLSQMTPVAARGMEPVLPTCGKTSTSPGVLGESVSNFPATVDLSYQEGGVPSLSTTPKCTTPVTSVSGKKQKTGFGHEKEPPNHDWVAALPVLFSGDHGRRLESVLCGVEFHWANDPDEGYFGLFCPPCGKVIKGGGGKTVTNLRTHFETSRHADCWKEWHAALRCEQGNNKWKARDVKPPNVVLTGAYMPFNERVPAPSAPPLSEAPPPTAATPSSAAGSSGTKKGSLTPDEELERGKQLLDPSLVEQGLSVCLLSKEPGKVGFWCAYCKMEYSFGKTGKRNAENHVKGGEHKIKFRRNQPSTARAQPPANEALTMLYSARQQQSNPRSPVRSSPRKKAENQVEVKQEPVSPPALRKPRKEVELQKGPASDKDPEVEVVEGNASKSTPPKANDGSWVWDEPDTPITPRTQAKKDNLRKQYLDVGRMSKLMDGPHKIKYRHWIRCATHPNYERWLNGSPDEKGNKIVPPKDIDEWIFFSPSRYLESSLGGPPVRRKIG